MLVDTLPETCIVTIQPPRYYTTSSGKGAVLTLSTTVLDLFMLLAALISEPMPAALKQFPSLVEPAEPNISSNINWCIENAASSNLSTISASENFPTGLVELSQSLIW